MDPGRLLDGLDPSQRRAVTSHAQPLAILAGAGSGKTRVLTRRIAHRCLTGDADARHVLALTFTRKAAGELDARLRAFGLRDLPAAGTFHAIAYAQLRTRWAGTSGAAPTLLDRKGRALRRILGRTTRFGPSDLAAEIEWARARLIPPERYEVEAGRADRRTAVAPGRIADWYDQYETDKRRRGLVDFDDLLAGCADALEHDPSFAAAQRWRFRHLFVDEYQDLNPLQERLLRAWLGDRSDLTVVGDPNQAIYGWNGADASFLVDFASQHPGAEVVHLEHTYRSSPQIVRTAGALLDPGGPGGTALEAHRPDGPVPSVVGYATDVDEANGIARAVHDQHGPGRPWSAQAVLVRTNAQSSLIEAAFRRAAIPHRVRGAAQLLDLPAVKDLLRTYDRSDAPLATTLADLSTAIDEDRAELGEDVDESSEAGRELAARQQVLRLGRDLLVVEPSARTAGFGGWLRTTLRDDGPDRHDSVAISSFHAAKGLEWSVVHVAGVEAGLVPITHARTPDQRAEERRLLYVASTRAADVLRYTWAAQRTFGSQTVDRKPSPLLEVVRAAVAELRRAEAHVTSPEPAVQASRAALGPPSPGLDAHRVRTELHAWRADVARQAGVRPTVVLGDKALEALVRRRPGTPEELEEVTDVGAATRARHGARLLAICASSSRSDSITTPTS